MRYRLKSDHGVECEAEENAFGDMEYRYDSRPVHDGTAKREYFYGQWEPVPVEEPAPELATSDHVLRNSETGSEIRGVKAEGDVARGASSAERPSCDHKWRDAGPFGNAGGDSSRRWEVCIKCANFREAIPTPPSAEQTIEDEIEQMAATKDGDWIDMAVHYTRLRRAAAEIRRLKAELLEDEYEASRRMDRIKALDEIRVKLLEEKSALVAEIKRFKQDLDRNLRVASEMATQFLKVRGERNNINDLYRKACRSLADVFGPGGILDGYLLCGEDDFDGAKKLAEDYMRLKAERDAARAMLDTLRKSANERLAETSEPKPGPREVRLRWVEGGDLQVELRDEEGRSLPFPAPIENISGVSAAPKSSQ